ncbi:hypothetical protein SAMN05444166_8417 [Singulisphaera sp. GP187]|nr:hypothetical protein SAMN05444166_8417 [Singulisphaera sp. GP187]
MKETLPYLERSRKAVNGYGNWSPPTVKYSHTATPYVFKRVK